MGAQTPDSYDSGYLKPNNLTAGVAGVATANNRGHEMQDRWSAGCSEVGAWALVADGVSSDPHSAMAAQTAIDVATRFLIGSDLLERSLLSAADAAAAAVEPWYRSRTGGTTLTLAAATAHRLTIVAIGDSPAYLLIGDALVRQTPPATPGPLGEWIGLSPRIAPRLLSRPYDPKSQGPVIIATDGLDLDGYVPKGPLAPHMLAAELLRQRPPSGADDAAVVIIALTENQPDTASLEDLPRTLRETENPTRPINGPRDSSMGVDQRARGW